MKSQLFLFIAFVICGAKAANILLFPGMMAASVCNEMLGFGEELETRGHKVMFYLPDKYDYKFLAKTKIKILKYRFKDEDKKLLDSIFKSLTEKVFGKKDVSFPNISSSQVRTTVMNTICDNVFADKDALNTLKKLKLDLVVVEALPYTKCLFFLPHYLNVSYAGLAANIDGRDGGLPFQGNTYPYILSTFSDKMTFIDRFKNVMMNILQFLLRPYMLPTRDPAEYDPSLAGSDAEELMRNAVLYLENSDHVVDYPKALMPNFVQVGGLTASPAKKLPPQLEKFMSGAADGIVVVSFGSILQEAPPVMMKKLMSAFSELKQKVLFKTDSDFVKGNVKGVKWFPQNDVLGHPAVKLFISHCGKNGFFESVYHGVPVICTPLNGDGFSTASKVENKHIGISLDLNSVSSNDIVKAVDKVLSHSSYKENMKRTSLLLRDRPGTAPARAASAIEHVIKYGGDHMKSSSRHLSLMSYLYADIWFFIFSVIVTVLYILFYIVRFICCRKRQVTKKKSD